MIMLRLVKMSAARILTKISTDVGPSKPLCVYMLELCYMEAPNLWHVDVSTAFDEYHSINILRILIRSHVHLKGREV